MNSASLCSLAGRYDNPLPPRFLAPIDSLKIPALLVRNRGYATIKIGTEEGVIYMILIKNGSAILSLLKKVCNSILYRNIGGHFVAVVFGALPPPLPSQLGPPYRGKKE
jgi:hypothetical protein